MRFEFTTATRILFGPGIIAEVPALAVSLGQRIFLVTDSKERCKALLNNLSILGLSVLVFLVEKEPDFDSIIMATRNSRDFGSQIIIGFGGGSVLDTGKTVAILMTNHGNLLDYVEVVGKGQKFENPSIPFIAIPTTSGTGSEVTRNAVLLFPDRRLKASLRSEYMYPRVAVIDPELTYSLPPSVTASTGMDALTQLIEPFVCNSPTPLTDALCRDGIARAARALASAYRNGADINSRQDMCLASLFGGMALANARLGAVHGMANPIGGMSHAPHGAVCARLLPLVMETNLRTLRGRFPDSPAILRYEEIAHLLTGDEQATADDGINWVKEICQVLNIRPLGEYGLNPDDFSTLVEQSQKANSMKGNPVAITDKEIMTILISAV